MVNEIKTLEPPYEILDLGDGGQLRTTIENWQLGKMKITPRTIGEEKEILALRIWVPEDVKPTVPGYYDITSQTLIAGLRGYLEAPGWKDLVFTIVKHGVAPTARFEVRTEKKS